MTIEPAITGGITRRTALVAGAGAVGIAALAACSSDSSTSSAPATKDAGGGSENLVALDSIKVGEAVSAKLSDGSKIVVARPTSSTAAAFSATCTHQGCTVAPAGKELHCPCHGSKFDAATGKVINGPASKPLPKVAVHVAGGQVVAST
jgi:Rieske Fe-S protein